MKAIFNGEILGFNDLKLSPDDRGFRYGDGLFETIALINSNTRLLNRHYARIAKGAQVFGFDLTDFELNQFTSICSDLIINNPTVNTGKIRFSIWRKGGGLYTPSGNGFNYLLTIHPLKADKKSELTNVGFSEKVRNYPTYTSTFKTISALKYVMAGLEKKEKSLDDIIINDHNGFVSETLDSNIFMKKDGIYITPPIASGCIDGVMRGWLIDKLKSSQIPVEERLFIPNELLEAASVFTTNSIGVRNILRIEDVAFEKDLRIQGYLDAIS